jgi:hypothetical protein
LDTWRRTAPTVDGLLAVRRAISRSLASGVRSISDLIKARFCSRLRWRRAVERQCQLVRFAVVGNVPDFARRFDAQLGGDPVPVVAVQDPAVLVNHDRHHDTVACDVIS